MSRRTKLLAVATLGVLCAIGIGAAIWAWASRDRGEEEWAVAEAAWIKEEERIFKNIDAEWLYPDLARAAGLGAPPLDTNGLTRFTYHVTRFTSPEIEAVFPQFRFRAVAPMTGRAAWHVLTYALSKEGEIHRLREGQWNYLNPGQGGANLFAPLAHYEAFVQKARVNLQTPEDAARLAQALEQIDSLHLLLEDRRGQDSISWDGSWRAFPVMAEKIGDEWKVIRRELKPASPYQKVDEWDFSVDASGVVTGLSRKWHSPATWPADAAAPSPPISGIVALASWLRA